MSKSGMSANSMTLPQAPDQAQSASALQGQSQTASQTLAGGYRLPEMTTLQHAAKLSIVEDKPIMLDYWTSSLEKTVIIGVKENSEKLLVKSQDEYTSGISKIYKVGTEYIIMTENSIYIVDVNIASKRISA
jgi:hypothetical protein